MANDPGNNHHEAVVSWYKRLLDQTVEEMMRINVVNNVAIEATPAWVFPYKVLISKLRNTGQRDHFFWLISGEEAITDHIGSSLAASPREAARHFSLKWQLDAERLLSLEQMNATQAVPELNRKEIAERFAEKAEYVNALVNMDEIWEKQVFS